MVGAARDPQGATRRNDPKPSLSLAAQRAALDEQQLALGMVMSIQLEFVEGVGRDAIGDDRPGDVVRLDPVGLIREIGQEWNGSLRRSVAELNNNLSNLRNDAMTVSTYPLASHQSTAIDTPSGAIMNSLNSGLIAETLTRLHQDAEAADTPFFQKMMAGLEAAGGTIQQAAAQMIADERADYAAVYSSHAEHFLSVSPSYGRFLYGIARSCKETRIVEFGKSMGISTI